MITAKFYRIFSFKTVLLGVFILHGFLNAAEKTVEISLPTIQCGRCVRTIEKALDKSGGIINSDIDVENKKAVITYDDTKTDLAKIEDAISSAGYDANGKKADPVAYKKLHGCCKMPEDR